MVARVFRIRASADRLEATLRALEATTEELRAATGLRHAYVLLDRQGGELMTVTLWESEAAMTASQARARELIAGVVQAAGGEVSGPTMYEVGLEI